MKHPSAILALVIASTALSACGWHGGRPNRALCAAFKAPTAPATPAAQPTAGADAATPVDACVRRWAYSLAGARDTAETVADAAVAACSPELSRWNEASPDSAPPGPAGAPMQALALETGLPTNAIAEHAAFARRHALLYAVEARAGRCRPPPVVKGVPVG